VPQLSNPGDIATATATNDIATATNGRSKKGKYVSEADAIKQGDRYAAEDSDSLGADRFFRCARIPVSATDYAQTRACFRSGEIRVLDASGNIERTIAFNETDRKL
jgi:hypothetical protein